MVKIHRLYIDFHRRCPGRTLGTCELSEKIRINPILNNVFILLDRIAALRKPAAMSSTTATAKSRLPIGKAITISFHIETVTRRTIL